MTRKITQFNTDIKTANVTTLRRKIIKLQNRVNELEAEIITLQNDEISDEEHEENVRALCDLMQSLPPSAYKPGSEFNPNHEVDNGECKQFLDNYDFKLNMKS